MRISPLGVATGYIEADTEARKEEKQFLKDTLKTGISNWNTFNMGQQSKQQAELAKTKSLISQLEVAIPTNAFSHLSPEKAKSARANAIISIAKGGENSVKSFLTNKTNFLNNAQTKALSKNYGFGYNEKLQTQKFFNSQFTLDDEVMYTDVDEWSIQNAMDQHPTNKFNTQTVVGSMGNRYKIDKASVNNYVDQLKLAYTGGGPIGLMRSDPNANTTHNGVVYHAGSVMPVGDAAVAAGAMLDVDWKNATFDSRVAQEVSRELILNAQAGVANATKQIDINLKILQEKSMKTKQDMDDINLFIAQKTKNEQIELILNQVKESEFGANGTLAQQYNLNISTIQNLSQKLEAEHKNLSTFLPGSQEYVGQKVKISGLTKQLSDEYAKGSNILTAVEVFNQAQAYGANMGAVENLNDFFTNADYRATSREMAAFVGSITGQGFSVDPNTGVVLWTSEDVDEKLALNQATYVAATMVRDEMKNQSGGYNYLDALNAVKSKMQNQSWLDQFTLDGDPVLKLRAKLNIPGFDNAPQNVVDMAKNLQPLLLSYQKQGAGQIGLNKINIDDLKKLKSRFRTNIQKFYADNNLFGGNKTQQTNQAKVFADNLFEQYGFDF